ncbi:MAG: hypothetical protein ACK6CT_07770 [Planctomycetia bacterium]|jgi:hypothetical protein
MIPAPPSFRPDASWFGARLHGLRAAGLVRLDDVELLGLAEALAGTEADAIELVGSRVDATARGGDIDLLVMTAAPSLETARRISNRFFARCEERIDVIVIDPLRMTAAQEAFVSQLRRVRVA